MALFDFLKTKTPEQNLPEQEARSSTYAGPVVLAWDAAFGGYGKQVDKISLVYGCIQLRASTIASLPIQLNRRLEKGHETAKDHPYYELLTKNPNPWMTNYTFWYWAITQLDMFGNVYIQKLKRNNGTVAELIPLNPDTVRVEIMPDTGMPLYKMTLVQFDGKKYYHEFTLDDIIHIKGYTRNSIFGMSVVDTYRSLFDGYNALEQAGTQIAKNAAKPNGVVFYPGNIREDELQKLKAGWAGGFSGDNSGKTAFLPNTLKFEQQQSGLTAQQAEYISQKQFNAQRIVADIFRCPLHMFGLTNAPTYASVEQNAREFVQYTLTPIITNIEQQIQKQLLDDSDDVYINFNVNGLLRGDVKARIEYYKFALEHGVMTPNQVSQEEDLGYAISKENGGDTYVRNTQFIPVDGSNVKNAPSGSVSQNT